MVEAAADVAAGVEIASLPTGPDGAFAFTAGLAVATGAYPLIIQASFNAFKDGNTDIVAWVMAAIIAISSLRSVMLYMQTVSINRVLLRLTTDMQTRAFAHLIHADYAPYRHPKSAARIGKSNTSTSPSPSRSPPV